jgi:DNA-binding transcriptional ArsR family regulator
MLGANMTRNMDTIRKIVLAVREAEGIVSHNELSDITEQEFSFHAQLLDEAGLVYAALSPEQGKKPAKHAIIFRLTWAGHDFADSIVDDTLWRKAKENVIKPTASWTFSILIEYLKLEIRRRIPGLESLP